MKTFSTLLCPNCSNPSQWTSRDFLQQDRWEDKINLCLCTDCKKDYGLKLDVYPNSKTFEDLTEQVEKACKGFDGFILTNK